MILRLPLQTLRHRGSLAHRGPASLFRSVLDDPFLPSFYGEPFRPASLGALEISEDNKSGKLLVAVDTPGIKKQDVKVSLFMFPFILSSSLLYRHLDTRLHVDPVPPTGLDQE